MGVIYCKSCKKSGYVKNGFVRGLQRYKCKFCNCNFTNTLQRSKPQGVNNGVKIHHKKEWCSSEMLNQKYTT